MVKLSKYNNDERVLDMIPEITTEVSYSVPEHQVLLSFNTDEDAEEFCDWWNTEGMLLFKCHAIDKVTDDDRSSVKD